MFNRNRKAERAEALEQDRINRKLTELNNELSLALWSMEKKVRLVQGINRALEVAPNNIEHTALFKKLFNAKQSLLCTMGAYDSRRQEYNAYAKEHKRTLAELDSNDQLIALCSKNCP